MDLLVDLRLPAEQLHHHREPLLVRVRHGVAATALEVAHPRAQPSDLALVRDALVEHPSVDREQSDDDDDERRGERRMLPAKIGEMHQSM